LLRRPKEGERSIRLKLDPRELDPELPELCTLVQSSSMALLELDILVITELGIKWWTGLGVEGPPSE